MTKQALYVAPSGWLSSAVGVLKDAGIIVVAPVETESGVVELESADSLEVITPPDGTAHMSLKRLFLPVTEVLLEFEKGENGDVDVHSEPLPASDEVVVIGCRPCDAASLEALDKVFQWDYDDLRYRARRERITLISFACTKAAPECFCTSVGGSPHDTRQSDVLVFPDDGGGVLLQVLSTKGEKFIERLGDLVTSAPAEEQPPPVPELSTKFDPEKVKCWLDGNFESDFWARNSMGCLGCGACSCFCPTCHCFDIVDEATWNRGQRRRNWDSCSFAMFTLHASGHNPRPDQAARCRQRIMHKFKYFPERFGQVACVGCGRCIKICGVGRNLTNTLAEINSR